MLYASAPLIAAELLARSFLGEAIPEIALYALITEAVLVASIGIDLFFLRDKSGLATFRRLSTVSIIGNGLWLVISIVGSILFIATKNEGKLVSLVILGAFFAMSFRAIILGSVFFGNPVRGLPLSIVQPALLVFPVVLLGRPISLYSGNIAVAAIGGIIALVGTEIYLSLINKPVKGFKALHLLQAFLAAWTAGNPTDLERYFQKSSEENRVSTEMIRLESPQAGSSTPAAILVVPGIHPGPFSPVGSSNLPGDIYQKLRSESTVPLIFHSISDHDLNLPSKEEVRKYAESLENLQFIEKGKMISDSLVTRDGKATASGFALGRTLLITLTLAPNGMEDLPEIIRRKIEEASSKAGFDACLVIDSHNSLGEKPDDIETQSLISASAELVERLSGSEQSPFMFGFAHTSEVAGENLSDIGPAGVGLLLFETKNSRFCLVVADANNSRLGFREEVMYDFHSKTSENLLEICTSDTHVTAAKANNAKGYLALGDMTTAESFSTTLQQLLEKAKQRLSSGIYETAIASSSVRTIGSQVLNSFSGLLDRSTMTAKRGAQVLGILGIIITLAVAIL